MAQSPGETLVYWHTRYRMPEPVNFFQKLILTTVRCRKSLENQYLEFLSGISFSPNEKCFQFMVARARRLCFPLLGNATGESL
jgi:hypothetical protein